MKKKMTLADWILVSILVLLAVPVLAIIVIASPVLGISVPIAGLVIAFRRRLGRLKVGLILLLLGIALAVAALTSSERWQTPETIGYGAWVAEVRRNPCGPREAMLLLAALFLAGGSGMAVAGKFAKRKE